MDILYAWLTINRLQCTKLSQLAIQRASAQAVLELSFAELHAHGIPDSTLQKLRHSQPETIQMDLEWLQKNPRHHIVCWEDPLYPPQLKEIPDPPPLLYIKGNPNLLAEPQIAVVGSRNPSPMGLELAREFALGLSSAGFIVTSGLALGVDGTSHKAAVGNNHATIAVLGSGLEQIYPRAHHKLADIIVEKGSLISEHSSNEPPRAHHFPKRNRIISGLSHGVLVVEASCNSGSLITARLANEQGREVFAIPGSPHHSLAAGCNHLIQQGAKLVSSLNDLLEELKPSFQLKNNQTAGLTHQFNELELDSRQHKLLECTGFELSSVDQIVARSGLPPETLSPLLLELELKGYIKACIGGYIRNLTHSNARQPKLTDRE